MKRPQKFIQLISSDIVASKLKQQAPQNHFAQNFVEKKWRIDLWPAEEQNFDQEGNEVNCMHVFLSNGCEEQVFQFVLGHQLYQGDLMQIEKLFNVQPGNKIDMAIIAAPEQYQNSYLYQSVIGQKKPAEKVGK